MNGFPDPYAVDVALSQRSHERAGGRRTDEAWLEETWADPATRVVVFGGGRFPLTAAGDAVGWVAPADAPAGERVFLGLHDDVAHFALLPPKSFEVPDDWAHLWTVGPLLTDADAGLLVQAQALAEWHRSHRFCPRCGGRLRIKHAGYVQHCDQCGREQFPRTDPAVIMLVSDGERALLGRQAVWPEGRFSTLAGFVDPGESLEDAVRREVMEEVGVEVGEVSYFGNQPWPFPQSLMVGFFARAESTEIDVDGDEIEAARWFTRDELRAGAEDGTLLLPRGISISRSLVEAWYGGALPGEW